MPDHRREIAEQVRLLAATARESRKQRLLHLAELHDCDAEIVVGSRRAIADSKALITAVEKLLN
jgi:hypothetical protein